jgi:hypothetical protein
MDQLSFNTNLFHLKHFNFLIMKTRTILFAAGLLATAFQSSAQISTVVGSTKIPLKLQITKQSPYCHGDQNGTILIDIIGGQAPYFVNDQMINGSSFQMANLSAGSYRIEVADNAVSNAAADVVLVDPAAVQVSSIVNNVSTYHGSNGSINLMVSDPSLTFVWEGNSNNLIISQEDQSGLSAGIYGVNVTNDKGCSTYRKFVLTQPNAPVVTGVSNPQVSAGTGMPAVSNISVYPNPSSGHVNLRADASVRSAMIMNDLGIVLKQLDFTNEGKLTGLDLNPGVYTLISIDELGNRATERIVIR